jgi:uncharacterized Tic20 family protein
MNAALGLFILLIGAVALCVYIGVVWRARKNHLQWNDRRSRRELTYAILLFFAIFSSMASIASFRLLPPSHVVNALMAGVPWGSILAAGVVMLRISLRKKEGS